MLALNLSEIIMFKKIILTLLVCIFIFYHILSIVLHVLSYLSLNMYHVFPLLYLLLFPIISTASIMIYEKISHPKDHPSNLVVIAENLPELLNRYLLIIFVYFFILGIRFSFSKPGILYLDKFGYSFFSGFAILLSIMITCYFYGKLIKLS